MIFWLCASTSAVTPSHIVSFNVIIVILLCIYMYMLIVLNICVFSVTAVYTGMEIKLGYMYLFYCILVVVLVIK